MRTGEEERMSLHVWRSVLCLSDSFLIVLLSDSKMLVLRVQRMHFDG